MGRRTPQFMMRLGAGLLAVTAAAACTGGDQAEGGSSGGAQVASAEATAQPDSCGTFHEIRGLLGEASGKIRREDGRTYVWAGGDKSGPGAEWFDFTDSPVPAEELQYGIGKDRIRAIDDPVFVSPDDPRLMEIPPSRYRPCERPESNDDIMVIGYVAEGQPRAYPTALLDRHELVNDVMSGKPFTVGW